MLSSGKKILVHGYSRLVETTLNKATEKGSRLTVFVTEARPDCSGNKMVEKLASVGHRL